MAAWHRGYTAVLILAGVVLYGLPATTSAKSKPEPTTPHYLETPLSVIDGASAGTPDALFRIPLGTDRIKTAGRMSKDRILVSVGRSVATYHVIFDMASGEEIWKTYDTLATVLPGMALFKDYGSGGTNSNVIAIDQNGEQLWSSQLEHSAFHLIPVAGGVLLAKGYSPTSDFSVVSVQDGSVLWRKAALSVDLTDYHSIHALGDALYAAGDGFLAKISPGTGEVLWVRDGIRVSEKPLPRWEDGVLFLVYTGGVVVAVNAEDGKTHWVLPSAPGESVQNLFPKDGDLYVRSVVSGTAGSGASHRLSRISADGKLLWQANDQSPIVSNLVDGDGKLFGATSQELIAWDLESGNTLFRKKFASLPSSYPVSVLDFDDHVVVLAELMITSFAMANGDQRYRHGFNPVLQNVSVTLMDRSIAKLQSTRISSAYDGSMAGAAGYFSSLSAINQERSNSLYNSYLSKKSQGDYWGAQRDWTSSQMESSWAKTNAITSVQFMGIDGILRYEASELAKAAEKSNKLLAERRALRQTILSEFPEMTEGDYAYRPIGIPADNGSLMGLATVHLPTGKKSVTTLSPVYRDYGLWLMFDAQTNEVLYQGLGLDTSAYEWKKYGSYEAYESYLIRQPIPMQE